MASVIVFGLSSLLGVPGASAQAIRPMLPANQGARSQPQLSPYLNLLREDNSTLSPYHSFVRPQRENLQQQSQQSSALHQLENRVYSQQRGNAGGLSVPRLPTGNGAKFQSYSHFYQFAPVQP